MPRIREKRCEIGEDCDRIRQELEYPGEQQAVELFSSKLVQCGLESPAHNPDASLLGNGAKHVVNWESRHTDAAALKLFFQGARAAANRKQGIRTCRN
jgi:hypothetical protein